VPHSARTLITLVDGTTPGRRLIPAKPSLRAALSGLCLVFVLFLIWRLMEPVNPLNAEIAPAQTASSVAALYSATSFWNTPIAATAATDPNSSAIIASAIAAYASGAVLSNDNAWGMGYTYADAGSKTYTVACTMYCGSSTMVFPIPAGALASTGSDHHLAVINGNQEMDMWEASYDARNDSWKASTITTTSIHGWGANCAPGQHCVGTVAAGFAMLGGSVRPEEIAQGHIDHALALMTPATKSGYITCPATNTDGASSNANAIPEGALIQLDPAFNVDGQSWPAWEKTIARALQSYGAYVVDTGGAMSLYGVTDMNRGNVTWSSVGMTKAPSLSNLPWSSFRVLQIHSCN